MKSQTSTEFIILLAIIMFLLIISSVIVFDLPSVINNLRQVSTNNQLESGDIGILFHSFNSTSGKLSLRNNLPYLINLSVYTNSTPLYTGLILNPSESSTITFYQSLGITTFYELTLNFEYINLENQQTYGTSAFIKGDVGLN